jgi:hypothetical protein
LAFGFGAVKMPKFIFYPFIGRKVDRSRSWTVDARNATEARKEASRLSGIKGTQLIVFNVREKNPLAVGTFSRASVIYAQRKRRRGEVMYWDGHKFTNNNPPKYFGTHDRARGVAQILVKRFNVLRAYKVWVGPALASMRRRNPESLDEAARRLEDFSGHAVKKTIQVSPRSHQTTGLVIGELDLIGYRTKRAGIAAGKLIRYAHDFSKGSRPLLAVSSDGKQLHIVGGRYEFTEAGIEDR